MSRDLYPHPLDCSICAEQRRTKWTKILAVAVLVIWTYAGYAAGLAKGKGWRDMVRDMGCLVVCPPVKL